MFGLIADESPNKTPEPTAVAAAGCATSHQLVEVLCRRWLSLVR